MVFVLNFGGSSFKYKIFGHNELILEGICEKIGDFSGKISIKFIKKNIKIDKEISFKNHREAFKCVIDLLFDKKNGILKEYGPITAIGHRVVHGGTYFNKSVTIDENVIKKIKELIPLAPIHNQANINGILDCYDFFGKNIPQIAVFDTSFFANLPKKVYTYAIPKDLSAKYNIRKYGFHGISHKYVYNFYKNSTNENNLKIITCHLGSGSSMAAIIDGNPVDTTMGLTPLGGLIMNTRCGSLDPSVVIQLMKYENLSLDKITKILNNNSGILGISELSEDVSKVLEHDNENCKLAIDMYCYKIIKYIGAYITIMNGCDAIIFTAGIGENCANIRKRICENLTFFGIKLNNFYNNNIIFNEKNIISNKKSKIKVAVIFTDEEKGIYNEVKEILKY
ncbi:MAG: acetate kinase [Candidatus Improbicoccus devescovinae]|nr:MAG: acetate kinase [Candidatus Improbicoccus devescovinae]